MLNEMNKTVDNMKETLAKLNEYYDANLRFNSVQQMAKTINELEAKLERKANSVDVKKFIPRISKTAKFNFI